MYSISQNIMKQTQPNRVSALRVNQKSPSDSQTLQHLPKSVSVLPTRRVLAKEKSKWVIGDLPKELLVQTDSLASSKICQYLAGGDLLSQRGHGGRAAAMALPGSRWAKTEGERCKQFISCLRSIRQSKARLQTKAELHLRLPRLKLT